MPENNLYLEIQSELKNLHRLSEEMRELSGMLETKTSFVEIRAAGSILHDFYCGVEKIFERIALAIDGKLSGGENWHTELLLQMTVPVTGKRDAVISGELIQTLKEYLRFRHLFRNIYGFSLSLERFQVLCEKLENTLQNLEDQIDRLLTSM